ncbi:MAG: hypothetical protein OHK0046_22100 [Anaerolineae bacterium]
MRKQTLLMAMLALCVLALVSGNQAHAGQVTLPPERRIDWSNAGIPGGIPSPAVAANVKDLGAVGDGVTDDSQAFLNAIESVGNAGGGAIYIPEGTYLITQQLRISKSNIVLRGAGSDKTSLKLNITENSDAISFRRYEGYGAFAAVVAGYERGSTTLTVDDPAKFKVGDYIEITQDNAAWMFTQPQFDKDWADEAVGQMLQVTAITGNNLTIDTPLFLTYSPALNVRARSIREVKYAGIENLHIVRVDPDNAVIMDFRSCVYCWVKNIESEYAFRIHVRLERCYHCEVRDSYFHHAHAYGDGGQGYGVSLNLHTTLSLVENNIFHDLRHAMIMATGAIGNVWAYNYSANALDWLADISLHGHYPSYNLFESNLVQNIQSADQWGPSGPGNTFLRNVSEITHLNNQGFRILDHSVDHNLLGNIIKGDLFIDPSVTGTILHGNKVDNVVNWDPNIADRDLPVSLYRTSKPAFYGDMAWPSIGADLQTYDLPARRRYLQIIGENPGGPISTPTVDLKLTEPTGTLTATRGNPTYRWEHEDGITNYQIYVNPASNVTTPVFFGTLPAAQYCSGAQCSVDLTKINGGAWLSNGTYHVYLAAGNTWNLTPSVFTVNVPQPGIVNMQSVTNTSNNKPTLSWTLSGSAEHNAWFHIYVAPTSALTAVAVDTWVERSQVCSGSTCNFQVPQSLANNHYSAYIQGWGPGGLSTGGFAGWAGPVEFNLGPARPAVPENVNVSLNNKVPTVTWSDDPNATEYNVYVGIVTPITQIYYITLTRASACSSGTCQFTAPDTFPAGSYHAFVQAVGAGGIGLDANNPLGWSAEASFTVN